MSILEALFWGFVGGLIGLAIARLLFVGISRGKRARPR